jgi:prevent-host-death family protein
VERTVGVEEARNQLGRLADEVNRGADTVVLTRRGRPIAVLIGSSEYERIAEAQRRAAQDELRRRVDALRRAVDDAGLDIALVDEAIAAARAAG